MLRSIALVVALGCGVSLATPISPQLRPKSSEKFFGKDYPADKHPVADEHYAFDHPYPTVQDTGDYENDYVKDSNADGGKWQMQMKYDILRQKVQQAEKELEKLQRKLDTETAEMKEAKGAWQEALDKVQQAEHQSGLARKEEGEIKDDVKDLHDEVHVQAKKVEKEMKDFEGCKKALADAKNRLKDLLDESAKREMEAEAEMKRQEVARKAEETKKEEEERIKRRKQAEEDEDVEKKVKREAAAAQSEKMRRKEREAAEEHKHKEAAKRREDDAKQQNDEISRQNGEISKKNDEVKKEVANMKKSMADDEAAWKKQIAQKKSLYHAASTDYDEVLQEIKETEAAMKKAQENLKKYRRPPHVDDNGGVYNVPDKKSGASAWHLSAFAAMLAAMTAL